MPGLINEYHRSDIFRVEKAMYVFAPQIFCKDFGNDLSAFFTEHICTARKSGFSSVEPTCGG
jgi:hypothetical protein